MIIPPRYKITTEIVELITKIESLRLFFTHQEYPTPIKKKIIHIGHLQSSLYSARIEGNPLTEVPSRESAETVHTKEIFNIIKAIDFLENTSSITIDLPLLLKLHSLVMEGISPDAGILRKEAGAIFDGFGNVVYISPPPEEIRLLSSQLFTYIVSDVEKFPLICAFVAHLIFEKIHPFVDGNGRVGRLLINTVFKIKQYNFGFFIPYEEYIDTHKAEYYAVLDRGLENTEDYLIFMLRAFYGQVQETKRMLDAEADKLGRGLPILPPRQEEIYHIIKDHRVVSIDFLQRRFLKVPKRTLNYDLKKLLDARLLVKIGKTRGSHYTCSER